MKVVIITGTAPHHQALCSVIDKSFDVVGILHPLDTPARSKLKLKRLLRQIRSNGIALSLLDLFSRAVDRRFFSPADNLSTERSASISAKKIHNRCDIRS